MPETIAWLLLGGDTAPLRHGMGSSSLANAGCLNPRNGRWPTTADSPAPLFFCPCIWQKTGAGAQIVLAFLLIYQ